MKEQIKKCVKCGQKKSINEFGLHADSSDGHQSYCKACKNALGKRRRQMNMGAYLKHHMATRIATQLGDLAPANLSKNLELHLGYKIIVLRRHLTTDLQKREPRKKLRTALIDEGYHVDHIFPLSRFPVVKMGVIDWAVFQECWAIENLSAIPAAENLAKGAKVEDSV